MDSDECVRQIREIMTEFYQRRDEIYRSRIKDSSEKHLKVHSNRRVALNRISAVLAAEALGDTIATSTDNDTKGSK